MTVNQVSRLEASGQRPVLPVSPSVAPALVPGLFVPSGLRSYNGADYDFSGNGLYTIFSLGVNYYNAGNCISYSGDVVELMRSLAYLTQYGWRDESLTSAQAQNQMRLRKIGMRCGPIDAIVAKPICTALGVPYRTVQWLTADTPNGFDDGHVACEVRIGGVWNYFDIPTKAYVTDSSSVVQNVGQIAAGGLANLTTYELCAGDCYPETWSGTAIQTAVYYAQTLLTASMRDAWRQRIYQIPGIFASDGLTYFYLPPGTEIRQSWLLSLSPTYRLLSEADWFAKFYP